MEIDRGLNTPDRAARVAYIGIDKLSNPLEGKFFRFHYCENESEYAALLFTFFRECDHLGVDAILCQGVPQVGIGRALMDRIRRASEN
jgi:L-threonylcarbamoyladenylate synthase